MGMSSPLVSVLTPALARGSYNTRELMEKKKRREVGGQKGVNRIARS